jgi:hypothetical protein
MEIFKNLLIVGFGSFFWEGRTILDFCGYGQSQQGLSVGYALSRNRILVTLLF